MRTRHALSTGFRGRTGRRPECSRGFSHIGVLILVALMSVALAAAGEIWHTAQKREKEAARSGAW